MIENVLTGAFTMYALHFLITNFGDVIILKTAFTV